MIRQARGYVSLHQTIMVTWRLRKALPFQTAIVSMMFQRQQDNLLACNLIWLHRWSLGGMEPGTDLQVQKLWKHLPWGSLEESVRVTPKTLGQAAPPPRELAKSLVCTPTSSDTDKSSMEVDLQQWTDCYMFLGAKKGTILTLWMINIKWNIRSSTSTRLDASCLHRSSLMRHLALCDS